MRNLSMRGSTRRWSQSGGQNRPASTGWRLAFDRNYPSNQIGPNGRPVLSSAWRNNLSNYRFRMANANSLPARDVKAYRSVLDGLSARHPRSAYIRYSAAIYLARAGEWDDYTVACEKALAINPSSYRLQMELIRAYIGSFKNDEALQKLKTAARRWPNSTECHFFAASLYRRWKQYDKAAEETLAVQNIDPQADGIHEQLVEDYMRSGKVVEAVREIAESNPSIRHGMITFSVVLSGIFVVVAMGIAVLTHVALRPERRPLRPPT